MKFVVSGALLVNALCLVVGLVRLDWLLILIATVGFMASLLSHSGSD